MERTDRTSMFVSRWLRSPIGGGLACGLRREMAGPRGSRGLLALPGQSFRRPREVPDGLGEVVGGGFVRGALNRSDVPGGTGFLRSVAKVPRFPVR